MHGALPPPKLARKSISSKRLHFVTCHIYRRSSFTTNTGFPFFFSHASRRYCFVIIKVSPNSQSFNIFFCVCELWKGIDLSSCLSMLQTVFMYWYSRYFHCTVPYPPSGWIREYRAWLSLNHTSQWLRSC